ncbi:HORMA domain-containing protein 1 [Globomyces sp. JEL0801]|nr:HORMA domain-containing protein 1 [Globomyces sp. JEL0801]
MESYTFQFSYTSDDQIEISASDSSHSLGNVSRSTKQFVRSLEPLPENAFVTMKLYYQDHTPLNYEPPFFKADTSDISIDTNSEADLDIGDIKTPHHTVNLKIKTKCSTLEENDQENLLFPDSQVSVQPKVQEKVQFSQTTQDIIAELKLSTSERVVQTTNGSHLTERNAIPQSTFPAIEDSSHTTQTDYKFFRKANSDISSEGSLTQSQLLVSQTPAQNVNSQPMRSLSSENGMVTSKVRCCCNATSSNTYQTIKCEDCEQNSHLICYGYNASNIPKKFVCYYCTSLTCPVITLDEFTTLCNRRLILEYLEKQDVPSVRSLASITHLPIEVASLARNWLKNEQLIVKMAGQRIRLKSSDKCRLMIKDIQNRSFMKQKRRNEEINEDTSMPTKRRKVSVVQKDLSVL